MIRSLRLILPLLALLIGTVGGLADQHEPESFAGKLLVAEKSMPDPRFAESVIYLVRHNEEGAFGLIINKPMARLPLADMLRELDLEDAETDAQLDLYFGGPVQGELGFVLHSSDFNAADNTMAVANGFSVTGVRQVLHAIAEQKGPAKVLFAAGYSGWAPNQLDAELARGDWLIVDADESIIFDMPVTDKWPAALDRRLLKL